MESLSQSSGSAISQNAVSLADLIRRRMVALDLPSTEDFLEYLDTHPAEEVWARKYFLDQLNEGVLDLLREARSFEFPVPVLIHVDYRVVFVNKSLMRLLGVDHPEQVIGMNTMDFIPKSDRKMVGERVNHVLEHGASGGVVHQEVVLPDGSKREFLLYGFKTIFDGETALQLFLIDMEEGNSVIRQKQKHLTLANGLNQALMRLVTNEPPENVIGDVFHILLELFQGDRVYVFRNFWTSDGKIYTAQKYELCAGGVTSQIDHPELQMASYEELGYMRWRETLESGECIFGPVRNFPKVEQPLLLGQGVQSVLVAPIMADSGLWGFVGVDDCQRERLWTSIDQSTLKSLGLALGGYLVRQKELSKIRLSESALRKAQEIGKVGSFSFNIETGKWFFSPVYLEMFGPVPTSPSRFQEIGLKVMGAEDYGAIRQAFSELLRTKSLIRRGGQVAVEMNGKKRFVAYFLENQILRQQVVAIHGIVQDITEEVKRQQQFKKSSANMRAVLESTSDIIFALNDSYRLTAYNSSFHSMMNLWLGLNIYNGLDLRAALNNVDKPNRVMRQIRTLDQVMQGESVISQLNVKTGQREVQSFEMSMNPILGESGEIEGISVFGKNITEQLSQHSEIRKLNRTLELRVQQRSMALETTNKELENFAYSVSHDLRTPLRHLIGYSRLLNEKAKDVLEPDSLQYLEFVNTSARKMNQLIEDLLAYSRLGRKDVERTRFDVQLILTGLLDYFRQQVPDVEIRFQTALTCDIYADSMLVEALLTNLLSNSVKYRSKTRPCEITISTEVADGGAHLIIADNGIGFDMQYVDQVFGIFRRLHSDEDYEGSGIGMANVQRIMHRHGGNIKAWSEPDQGAVFTCFFPDEDSPDA